MAMIYAKTLKGGGGGGVGVRNVQQERKNVTVTPVLAISKGY